MFAACALQAAQAAARRGLDGVSDVLLLVVGTLVSFLVAWAVIAVFMDFIRRHGFVPFAIYRIALARRRARLAGDRPRSPCAGTYVGLRPFRVRMTLLGQSPVVSRSGDSIGAGRA